MASRIAYYYLNAIIPQIDFAIDLHTGGGQRHNYPQIRYTKEDLKSKELAHMFNAPITFSSGLIKGSFRNAAYRFKKPVIVFEAGESMRFDDFAIQQGISGILRVFVRLGMLGVAKFRQYRTKTKHSFGRAKMVEGTHSRDFYTPDLERK